MVVVKVDEVVKLHREGLRRATVSVYTDTGELIKTVSTVFNVLDSDWKLKAINDLKQKVLASNTDATTQSELQLAIDDAVW